MVAICNARFAASLFFQPSSSALGTFGLGTHDGAESYRGLFCGNDPINRFDLNGCSWLSKLWDHTILKIGQQAAINWDHQGRQITEMVAVIAASFIIGGEVEDFASNAFSELAGVTSTTTATATGYSVTVTATGTGFFSSALGSTSGVLGGVAGGAAGGAFAGGTLTGSGRGALNGAISGAMMGGIDAYFGNSYTVPRIEATALGGGLASQLTGGNFRQGFEIGGVQGLMAYGWDQMRQVTDEMGNTVAGNDPSRFNYDNLGYLRTDGTIPMEPGGSEFGPTVDNAFRGLDSYLNSPDSTMGAQGIPGSHLYEASWLGGVNGPVAGFVNLVSKAHDFVNSWSYDFGNGAYLYRGAAADSMFQIYSATMMAPAGVYTSAALSPSTLYAAQYHHW